MGMVDEVKVKAKNCIKTIVLPEGDEPRTVQAAAIPKKHWKLPHISRTVSTSTPSAI